MPVADCGDYAAIPLSPKMPVADLGIRSGRAKRGRCPRILFNTTTNKINYKQFNTKKQIV